MKRILITLAVTLSINAQAIELNLSALKEKTVKVSEGHNDCAVDDRMNDLNLVIDQIKLGTLDKNLQITAEEFIFLKHDVVSLLKSNYAVVQDDCKVINVINSDLIEPIKINFAVLWNEILKAATNKDNIRVGYLIDHFTVLPMPAKMAVNNLLVPANIPLDIQASLANKLSVSLLKSRKQVVHHKLEYLTTHDQHSFNIEYSNEYYLVLLDVFRSLGGRLTGDLPLTISDNLSSHIEIIKVIRDNNITIPATKTFALLGYNHFDAILK